jgi:hypothetical protein
MATQSFIRPEASTRRRTRIPSKETKQSKVEEEQEKEVGEEKELTSTSKTAKPYALNTLHKHAKIGVCGTKPHTVQ